MKLFCIIQYQKGYYVSNLTSGNFQIGTLEYGISVHVRLLIFGKYSHLYALIPASTFINFWDFLLNLDQKVEILIIFHKIADMCSLLLQIWVHT